MKVGFLKPSQFFIIDRRNLSKLATTTVYMRVAQEGDTDPIALVIYNPRKPEEFGENAPAWLTEETDVHVVKPERLNEVAQIKPFIAEDRLGKLLGTKAAKEFEKRVTDWFEGFKRSTQDPVALLLIDAIEKLRMDPSCTKGTFSDFCEKVSRIKDMIPDIVRALDRLSINSAPEKPD